MKKSKSLSTYTKGNLYSIPCADLQTDPNQPRKYFDPDAQQDLVNSFQIQGVLQPILFREGKDDNLFIVAGERRLQAAKEAGLETIPAILVEGNYAEIALVENLLREDLTAIELAEALNHIMVEQDYTQEQLTGIIGKAKSTVSEILSLNRLPDEILDECRTDPSISRKTLIDIAKKRGNKGMSSAYRKYKERLSAPKKTRGPKGGRKSFQDRFASKSNALITSVTKTQLEKLDVSARKDLISRIEEMKKAADKLISQIKAVPVKVTKPVKAPEKEKNTTLAKVTPKPKEKKPAAKPKPAKESKGKKALKPAKKK